MPSLFAFDITASLAQNPLTFNCPHRQKSISDSLITAYSDSIGGRKTAKRGAAYFRKIAAMRKTRGVAGRRKQTKAMISIDISKVPPEKQTRPDFLNLKAQMEHALAQKQWINAFCIHEAGHMIYLTQLGVTEYFYIGPHIVYNQSKDIFDGYMAAVQPQTRDVTVVLPAKTGHLT